MNRRSFLLLVPGATVVAAAVSCSSTVTQYARCIAGDNCSDGSICESALVDDSTPKASTTSTTGASSSAPPPALPYFCTHSCESAGDCPSDSFGKAAVCAQIAASPAESRFCFATCTTSCPRGESCQLAGVSADGEGAPGGSMPSICVPTLDFTDGLSGTTWVSTTVTAAAVQCNVASLTYSLAFGPSAAPDGTAVGGTFQATVVVKYTDSQTLGEDCDSGEIAPSALAGCTETDTFTGDAWGDQPASATAGTLSIAPIDDATEMTVTNRTGCTDPTSNVTGATGSGMSSIAASQTQTSGTPYVITGNTFTAPIGPFSGASLFTKTN